MLVAAELNVSFRSHGIFSLNGFCPTQIVTIVALSFSLDPSLVVQ